VTEAHNDICVNNLPKVVTQLCPGVNLTHDLLIASPMPYRFATAPPTEKLFLKFNMSAILLDEDDTFHASSSFIDTAINELDSAHYYLFHFIHSFICHRNTLAAAGFPTTHDLPGSNRDCFVATSQAR